MVQARNLRVRKVERFQGGLVFKAHKLLYHSTLRSRVIKKKKKKVQARNLLVSERAQNLLVPARAPPRSFARGPDRRPRGYLLGRTCQYGMSRKMFPAPERLLLGYRMSRGGALPPRGTSPFRGDRLRRGYRVGRGGGGVSAEVGGLPGFDH